MDNLCCWAGDLPPFGAGMTDFKPFPKIPRLNREVVVTEKIDGTNALVYVSENLEVRAGSRKRWIKPGDDNFGFAAWVAEHEEELKQLGPGFHYGEWFGRGIQRGYGLTERRFALFNTHRWHEDGNDGRPSCCGVVPIIGVCYGFSDVHFFAKLLRQRGSYIVPGYDKPEGVVAFHTASNHVYKVLLEGDELPKGLANDVA